jgi:alcohol dehydrogenase
MIDFEFRTVTRVVVEWGGSGRLGDMVAESMIARRALVVTDAGLRRAGVLDAALSGLAAAGVETALFDEVLPDPSEAIVERAAARAREVGAQLVIGIGGGSSLDVAKLAAVLAASDQELGEIYGIGRVRGGRLALVLVPTTAGTGSEVTDIAIVTTGETTKMGVVSPVLFADLALLDASLTIGLPRVQTAATGIDAMVHAIEATTSRLRRNPVSDALAREALRLLSANLLAACSDGADRGAREAMLLGSMLAGQAFCNAPVGAVHALAYPLGGHYHVPHGLSNALMLLPVLRFNERAAAREYGGLAGIVGDGETGAAGLIAGMERLIAGSGAPRRLRDVGVTEDALPMLAAEAMKQTRLLVNNPVEVGEADARALYREAF